MLCVILLTAFLLKFSVSSFTSVKPLSLGGTKPRQKAAATTFLHASARNNEILLISMDDIVVDTKEWRTQQGIFAALKVWPHLNDLISTNDSLWLVNKMKALAHVTRTHVGVSPTCDYALLARLLLEEQKLDQGRSVGKIGKYATQFHPSSTERNDITESNSAAGSRPLTVGEIEINWSDGALLSDTLLARYNVDGKNPLAILQECIDQQTKKVDFKFIPRANHVVCDALSKCDARVILRVGHESDLSAVKTALSSTALDNTHVVHSIKDALDATSPCLLISDEISETQLFRQFLTSTKPGSCLYIIDKSWTVLQKSKFLFGDFIPRVGGKAKSVFGDEQQVSLHLWGETNSIKQCNNAEMDPWTNLMGMNELLELVSARTMTPRE